MLGGAMISMGRTLEKLGPKRQFTRVRGSRILRSSQAQSSTKLLLLDRSFVACYALSNVSTDVEYHREPRPVRQSA